MSAPLIDGYSTTIAFSLLNTLLGVRLGEKTVTPPEISQGGPIHISTMRTSPYRMMKPKKLTTVGSLKLKVAYDPQCYSGNAGLNSLLGQEQNITISFPDASIVTFRGWVESFKPDEMKEGTQPEADVVIEMSNCAIGASVLGTGGNGGPSYTGV